MSKPKVKYYAIKKGKTTGIFTDWNQCKEYVIGYKEAIYKSFTTQQEAKNYLFDNNQNNNQNNVQDNNQLYIDDKIDYIFCDGSEIKGTSKAGYGIYYPKYQIKENFQLLNQTNNQAEIKAIIRAFEILINNHQKNKKYIIVSDSKYVINSLLIWIPKWKQNLWKKFNGKIIENLELIKELDSIYQKLLQKNIKIELLHINSHQKKPLNQNSIEYYIWYGNYIADSLAKL